METPLTILYTHRLRGDLETLPKLYGFLRQLQAHYSEAPALVCADDPASPVGSVLRLDLGESCDPAVWHCAVSGGRSTLVVLDGMGFDAARVDNAAAIRAQMGDSVRLALVDGENPFRVEDVEIAVSNLTPPAPSPRQPQVARGEGELSDADRRSAAKRVRFKLSSLGAHPPKRRISTATGCIWRGWRVASRSASPN
ncbi:MAG: hypothetical protein U0521_06250 [Anaerolineae bacterium]